MAADTAALGDFAVVGPGLMELAPAHLARSLVDSIKGVAADYARLQFQLFIQRAYPLPGRELRARNASRPL